MLPAYVFAVEKQLQCPSCFFEGKGKDLKFVSELDQDCFSGDAHTQSKRSLNTDCKDLDGCMGNVHDAQSNVLHVGTWTDAYKLHVECHMNTWDSSGMQHCMGL